MKYHSSKRRGYTLVEVMVAVGILAILVSVAFAGYGEIKKSARDKQRVIDLEQIRLALRLYKEANGTYPRCWPGWVIGGTTNSTGPQCLQNVDSLLAPYMAQIPKDPLYNSDPGNYQYVYDSNYDCRKNGSSPNETVVYAKTTETSAIRNWGSNAGNVEGICKPIGSQPANILIYGTILGNAAP